MRLAAGDGAIDVDHGQGTRQQFDREGVDVEHTVTASGKPAAIDGPDCTAEGIGDDVVILKAVGFGKRDGVGGRVIRGLRLAEGDCSHSGGRQSPSAAAPWAGPQIDHEWIQSRGIHQTHGRVAHQRYGVGRPLREAGDASATAVIVDHPIATTEGVREAEIDRVRGAVNRVSRDKGGGEALERSCGPRFGQIDNHRNVHPGIGITGGELKCVGIGRVWDDVIASAIDQPADRCSAPGAVDNLLAQRKPMRLSEIDALGGPDDRRRRREDPAEIMGVAPDPVRIEIESQAVAYARTRMRDSI